MNLPAFFQTAFLLVVLFAFSPRLQAGASNKNGNPFGNGSFFPTSGTFNGVLRGVDTVGVTAFTTGTNTTLTGGPLYLYQADVGVYDDTMSVYATLDPSANSLSAFIAPSTNTPATPNTANNVSSGGGSFQASLKNSPTNQTYSGSGVISEIVDTNTAPVTTVNYNFVINGCRIGN